MNAIDSVRFESKKRKIHESTISCNRTDLTITCGSCSTIIAAEIHVRGECLGGQVIVKDVEQANRLHQAGDYGSFIGNRMNFVNRRCFSLVPSPVDNDDAVIESLEDRKAKRWLSRTKSQNWLFLSLAESLYLLEDDAIVANNGYCRVKLSVDSFGNASSFYDHISRHVHATERSLWDFVKSYCTYRYFRRRGWIVRDGLLFGANFLLYKEGVRQFHASAAVRIFDDGTQRFRADKFFGALQRELFTCKKTLFLAHFSNRQPSNGLSSLSDFSSAVLDAPEPQISLCDTWNPNRKRLTDLE